MWIVMSDTFRREAKEYKLVFTCEACAHFCKIQDACEMQYPTTPHRDHTIAQTNDGGRIYFCKMFEAE